jgi:hypothetical protein
MVQVKVNAEPELSPVSGIKSRSYAGFHFELFKYQVTCASSGNKIPSQNAEKYHTRLKTANKSSENTTNLKYLGTN